MESAFIPPFNSDKGKNKPWDDPKICGIFAHDVCEMHIIVVNLNPLS